MQNTEFVPLAPLLTKLGVMLTISLLVERFLAIFNWLMNRLSIARASTNREGVKQKEDELRVTILAAEEEALLKNPPKTAENPREIEANPERTDILPDSRFDVMELAEVNVLKVSKEFFLQVLGTVVAIAGCYYLKFSIWTFITWAQRPQALADIVPAAWEFVFTGIIIGAGSKPVNFLINFLLNRKLEVSREQVQEEAKPPKPSETEQPPKSAPVAQAIQPITAGVEPTPRTIEEILGFDYDGGDRPQRLENTHLFTRKIDLLVYHHTAMHSDSPFEEILKEFDRKGWLTGYNCVVLKDGTIRVLCRWDRLGNHTKEFNDRSLGVALHGNFETNPKVPFSNFNGQYGMLRPTAEQVDSMARVIALWILMHAIPINFPEKNDPKTAKGIRPHNHLAPKACPGNNFPCKQLEKLVKHYAATWKSDKVFKEALVDFKAMPMVMA